MCGEARGQGLPSQPPPASASCALRPRAQPATLLPLQDLEEGFQLLDCDGGSGWDLLCTVRTWREATVWRGQRFRFNSRGDDDSPIHSISTPSTPDAAPAPQLMAFNPSERPTAAGALAHPFVAPEAAAMAAPVNELAKSVGTMMTSSVDGIITTDMLQVGKRV